jgi:hypothetical protein
MIVLKRCMQTPLLRVAGCQKTHVRWFSEGGEPPRRSGREEFEEKQRKKVQEQADMDEKDETSF